MMALVIMFGSAFMFTKIAVQEYPPTIVAAGRIIIAAICISYFFNYKARFIHIYKKPLAFINRISDFWKLFAVLSY